MPKTDAPSWLNNEIQRSAETIQNEMVVNPAALPKRSMRGFRLREDYQIRFDTLVAREKIRSGKKGPDLIEEAMQLLFEKYGG